MTPRHLGAGLIAADDLGGATVVLLFLGALAFLVIYASFDMDTLR
jgi:hypothetical protein